MSFSTNHSKIAQTGDTMFQGYLEPEMAQDYFAEAEQTSIIQRVARKIPMGATGVKIPHWTGDVSAGWVGEGEMKPITKGDMTMQQVEPHKIATIFVESAEVVRANPGNYLGQMRTKVATAIASAFDEAALHGTDTPFSKFLDQSTKVQALGPNAYDSLAIHGLNKLAKPAVGAKHKWQATLLDESVESILNGSKDNNGRPLFIESTYEAVATPYREGRVVGRPTLLSDHVRKEGSNVVGYQGDFSQILWGQVGGLSYSATNQATLNLGTFESPSFVSLWQHNLVAVLVEAEYGLLINDVNAFVKLLEVAEPVSYSVSLGGASAGTFTLTFNGKTTTAIAYNATAGTVKSALVALDDDLDADDFTVTGSAGSYTVAAPGTLTGTFSGLTGATSPAVTQV